MFCAFPSLWSRFPRTRCQGQPAASRAKLRCCACRSSEKLFQPQQSLAMQVAQLYCSAWRSLQRSARICKLCGHAQACHVAEKLIIILLGYKVLLSMISYRTDIADGLPKHERPSPKNPSLQVQLCPPTVLVQFAFTSQLWFPFLHSSMSIMEIILYTQRLKLAIVGKLGLSVLALE